jgi:hypothetical protein
MVDKGWGFVEEIMGDVMRVVEEWAMILWREVLILGLALGLVLGLVLGLILRGFFLMIQSWGSSEELGRRSWCLIYCDC